MKILTFQAFHPNASNIFSSFSNLQLTTKLKFFPSLSSVFRYSCSHFDHMYCCDSTLIGLPFYWEKSAIGTVLLVIFGYWLLVNNVFHYYMAAFTSPGLPPEVSKIENLKIWLLSWQWVSKILFFFPQKQLYEAVSICKKCLTPKPPRTHHCSICNKCVLKMDHHCREYWVESAQIMHLFFWFLDHWTKLTSIFV